MRIDDSFMLYELMCKVEDCPIFNQDDFKKSILYLETKI